MSNPQTTTYKEKLSFLRERGWKLVPHHKFLVQYKSAVYYREVPLDRAYELEKSADRICHV